MQLFLNIPRVARAFDFMVNAHREQMYGDLPYFTHPLQVAENLPNPTEDELIAALLHDVAEDTVFTLADVSEAFGDNVHNIVELVTKDVNLNYMGNILRVVNSKNRSAMKVKWADNLANMTSDKSQMDSARRDRLNKKYAGSFPLLSAALGL